MKETAKNSALEYLEPLVGKVTDPYQMAILAYSLQISGSAKRTDAFDRLATMKRTSKFTEGRSI